jgi:CubicO group peptidase (beta-lactamase class C family)
MSTEQARSAWIPRNEVPATFEALTKGLVAVGQKYRVPGLAVAITCDKELVYSNSFGYADIASGHLVHDDSLFRIASISKSFFPRVSLLISPPTATHINPAELPLHFS